MNLISAAGAQSLDKEAVEHWGFNHAALVESAGRACAQAFLRVTPFVPRSLVALAGKGSNAADALVMVRTLILSGQVRACDCLVLTTFAVSESPDDIMPLLAEIVFSVQKLGVNVLEWSDGETSLEDAELVIDGITGTGLIGPLRSTALEMANAVQALDRKKNGRRPFIVSIDVPSGNGDGWQPGMPIIKADLTLAIEPKKLCLYTPSARPYAGDIVPVKGIFPPLLMERRCEAQLVRWDTAKTWIESVPKTAYKYERGLVEIRAGSSGSAGAAHLAALGAQAAGAGLVRLIVDPSLYPVIAFSCSGIMVTANDGENTGAEKERFSPAASGGAVLLGPGWGRGADRARLLQSYLPLEEQGVPLILDADAIALAKDMVFHGNALLTPHAGEFAAYTGIPKEQILANPVPHLCRFAAEKKVHLLFKSHVLYVVSPEGRLGIIDGMNPLLAAGGTGDVLAGFCAAISSRAIISRAISSRQRASAVKNEVSLWHCACAAASLLMQAANAENVAGSFVDPQKLACAAASIAGAAWLPEPGVTHER